MSFCSLIIVAEVIVISQETEIRFDFIRHGQSTAQLRPDLIGGRTADANLTALGQAQAVALGIRLKHENTHYDLIYSSPFPRTRQTAFQICACLGFDFGRLFLTPELMEVSRGLWEGQPREALFTPVHDAQAPWFSPPEGESHKTAQRRISEWLEQTFIKNESYWREPRQWRIAVVGHGTVFKCLFQDILGFESRFIGVGMGIENCSLSRFVFSEKGWRVICLNDAGHLVGLESEKGVE